MHINKIRIKKDGDWFKVYRGTRLMSSHLSHKRAKEQSGAIRRIEIKRSLRKLGIKRMPRSLI